MKKIIVTLLLATMALPGLLLAQTPPTQGSSTPKAGSPEPHPAPQLTRFDLDFPGGTPGELVKAIEKASQKELNAIVPTEFVKFQIPALKMRGVTVPELFTALTMANQKSVNVVTGTYYSGVDGKGSSSQYQSGIDTYGFKTDGVPREDSIWIFYHTGHAPIPGQEKQNEPVCRFYQLGPYLETYKVDDITTAIETGWRMLGEAPMPRMSFHKDTKLLIAVGESDKLKVIDSVLGQLTPKFDKPVPEKDPGAAKNREPAKP